MHPFEALYLQGESSSPKRRQNKGNKRIFVETNKQINIFHERGVLKGSFQGDTFENLQVSNAGGVLKAYVTDDLVFTPKNKKCSLKTSRFNLKSQFFKGLGKSMNSNKTISKLERKRSGG